MITRKLPKTCSTDGCLRPYRDTIWMPRNHSWKRNDFCFECAQSAIEKGHGHKERPSEPPTARERPRPILDPMPMMPPPEKPQRLTSLPVVELPGEDINTWKVVKRTGPKSLFCQIEHCGRVAKTRCLCTPHYTKAKSEGRLEEFAAPPKKQKGKSMNTPMPPSPVISAVNATTESLTERIRELERANETLSAEIADRDAALSDARRTMEASAKTLEEAAKIKAELKDRENQCDSLLQQLKNIDAALYSDERVSGKSRVESIKFLYGLLSSASQQLIAMDDEFSALDTALGAELSETRSVWDRVGAVRNMQEKTAEILKRLDALNNTARDPGDTFPLVNREDAETLDLENQDLDQRLTELHQHLDQIDQVIGFQPVGPDCEAERLAYLETYTVEAIVLEPADLQARAALSASTRDHISLLAMEGVAIIDTENGEVEVDPEMRGTILALLRSRDLTARTIATTKP